jgi:hypothetical protein
LAPASFLTLTTQSIADRLAAIIPAAPVTVTVTVAIAVVPVVPAVTIATPMLIAGGKPDAGNGKGENGQHSADKPVVHFVTPRRRGLPNEAVSKHYGSVTPSFPVAVTLRNDFMVSP